MDASLQRCGWRGMAGDALYEAYHDAEWGVPEYDSSALWEKLVLDGFQAGLAWITILRKREAFRAAFSGFDPAVVAAFGDDDIERLVGDAGIIRHRGKIVSTVNNARRALDLVAEAGSIATFVWRFEPDPKSRPGRFDRGTLKAMSTSPESVALSKAL